MAATVVAVEHEARDLPLDGPTVAVGSGRRRAAFAFVFVTVLLDMLALGICAPALPKLLLTFLHGDTAQTAKVYGLFNTVWALMQFLFSPMLGAISDRHGRRPVILISNFGLGLDNVLMALAPTLPWLFLGRVISGITAASVGTAGAYIADVSPPEKRAQNFGMLSAAFGIGFILGPAVGGLLGGIDPRLPFWGAAALSLANAMYGLFVLPESLRPETRASFSWRRANPVGALRLLRSHRELLGLSGVNFVAFVAHEVLPSVFVLYAGYRYGWGERAVGLTLAAVGACAAFVQIVLVKPMVERFGDRGVLLIGLAFGAAGFAIYGIAQTGAVFCIGIPVMSIWGMSGAAVQSLMTRHVGADEQGRLQGAQSSVTGIAGLIGPGLFTIVFARSIDPHGGWNTPGAAFELSAALIVVALILGSYVTRGSKRDEVPSTTG